MPLLLLLFLITEQSHVRYQVYQCKKSAVTVNITHDLTCESCTSDSSRKFYNFTAKVQFIPNVPLS